MVYPWQQEEWRQLWRVREANRLPHALLFAGVAGIGKLHFAECFASALMCQHLRNDLLSAMSGECTCHSCCLIKSRVHPNVLWQVPEKEGQAIKVDQIRDVNEFINQTSLQGDFRIVIIHPAHSMNASAANALLKTLEEPSSGSLLILISDQPSHLPPTILSRCQRITFPRPPNHQAISWLKDRLLNESVDAELILNLANGAPLAAMKFVEQDILSLRNNLFQVLHSLGRHDADPVKSAALLQSMESFHLLDFMLAWMMDLLRLQSGIQADKLLNVDYAGQLSELCQRTHMSANNGLMDYLLKLRGQINSGINFNKVLMTENILMRWMGCIAERSPNVSR